MSNTGLHLLSSTINKDIQNYIWNNYLCECDRWVVNIATNKMDKIKNTPLNRQKFARHCAKNGYLKLLKWSRVPLEGNLSEYAARSGNIELMKWLSMHKCYMSARTCAFAAFNGHLDLLKWLIRSKNCEVDHLSIINAAAGGHIHILEWVHPILNTVYSKFDACTLAAKYGHLKTLIWLHKHNYKWSSYAWSEAEKAEKWDCVAYLCENGCPEPMVYLYRTN